MGVKELWSILSPVGELLPLSSLDGHAVAVDLSCWVVDSQNVFMGSVVKPHLRNLLFRCISLLNIGCVPICVIEGEAPELKWDTINNRNKARSVGNGPLNAPELVSSKTGQRKRFKAILKECEDLLSMLGLPYVQAEGEAEATCAALQYHQVADGVISQDNDTFLYGSKVVYRNFTANTKKCTVEKFDMDLIDNKLHLNRNEMICLSIFLGCDYLPNGIPGVGKDRVQRLFERWREEGVDPIERMRSWSLEDCLSNLEINPKKGKRKKQPVDLETMVKQKALAVEGFPFEPIIQEYKKKLKIVPFKPTWKIPKINHLISWCIRKLEWEPSYAIEKIVPVVSRWIVTKTNAQSINTYETSIKIVDIIKERRLKGSIQFDVRWKISSQLNKISPDSSEFIITQEPLEGLIKSFPYQLDNFRESKNKKKKGSKSRKKENMKTPPKKKKESKDKKIAEYFNTIEDIFESDDDGDLSLIVDRIIGLDLNAKDKVERENKSLKTNENYENSSDDDIDFDDSNFKKMTKATEIDANIFKNVTKTVINKNSLAKINIDLDSSSEYAAYSGDLNSKDKNKMEIISSKNNYNYEIDSSDSEDALTKPFNLKSKELLIISDSDTSDEEEYVDLFERIKRKERNINSNIQTKRLEISSVANSCEPKFTEKNKAKNHLFIDDEISASIYKDNDVSALPPQDIIENSYNYSSPKQENHTNISKLQGQCMFDDSFSWVNSEISFTVDSDVEKILPLQGDSKTNIDKNSSTLISKLTHISKIELSKDSKYKSNSKISCDLSFPSPSYSYKPLKPYESPNQNITDKENHCPGSSIDSPNPLNQSELSIQSPISNEDMPCFDLIDSFSNLSFGSPAIVTPKTDTKVKVLSNISETLKEDTFDKLSDDSLSFTPKLSLSERLKSKYGHKEISLLLNKL